MGRTDPEKNAGGPSGRRTARSRTTGCLFLLVLLVFALTAWFFFSCGLPRLTQPHQRLLTDTEYGALPLPQDDQQKDD
ncbi:hypothetical protein IMZ48_07610, partial [Candidatus Bathyarchaeota archaeon]|nr:hypothetical protein [Candidatus Bathyarchaeota archaeon]